MTGVAGGAISLSNINFGQIIGDNFTGGDRSSTVGDITGGDKNSVTALNQNGVQAFDFSRFFGG